MKIKGILYLLLPTLAIILLNLFLGSIISWFLSIAIIACLLYYFAQINIEQLIYRKTDMPDVSDAVKAQAAQVIRKYKVILSFGLMTVIFISSIVCILRTTNPGGSHPWFLNSDYHGISNTGITFRQSLSLTLPTDDTTGDGGSMTFSRKVNDKAEISFAGFYQPVFLQTDQDGVYTPINDIFPQVFRKTFTLENGANRIAVQINEGSGSWLDFLRPGKQKRIVYAIDIRSNDRQLAEEINVPLPYTDHIEIAERALQEGKSLYNLLLNSRSFSAGRNESYAVLEFVLRQIGESYLLTHNSAGNEDAYSLFPSQGLIRNGYRLSADGQQVTPQLNNKTEIPFGKKFYIGFHNIQEKAYLSTIDPSEYDAGKSGDQVALLFDYPPAYLLSSPAERQVAGNKNLRFIANNNDEILSSDLREGFYFHNYGLNTPYPVNGTMDYLSQRPNVPMRFGIADNNRNGAYRAIENNRFSLQSSEPGVRYLFAVRDYSENGFRYSKLVLFAAVIYIGMLLVLIFFPGKSLVRIEPILFAVIYALLILRFILYWRLATFPPLENISKYELENTILNFDYRWGSIRLPIPFTLVWLFLFLIMLSGYRYLVSNGKPVFFSPAEKWNLKTAPRINKAYALFIGACTVLFFLNGKLLHIEILTRVSSIILPVIGYCYFAMLSNRYYQFDQEWVRPGESMGYIRLKAYIQYLIYNPAFLLTLITILFFALTDRGFAILFTLFILLKNIFLNFLKKPFNSQHTTIRKMLLNPNNYWIYGIAALVVYLVVLSFKSLFYYLLTYKLIVIGMLLLIPVAVLFFFYKKQKKITGILGAVLGCYLLLLLIPGSRAFLEAKATSAIKHVQYRASIIHQPISELLAQNPYSSFQTQKIIETAENQWFINSYVNKPYHNDAVINLRPYSKVGVDYNTQTRDVVIARFVIGELGNFTMYLVLLLTLLPLILYLISYRLTEEPYYRLNFRSYAGVLPLLLFFTLSLFVWLTATNRFVFFGQDFPFLSLTSKLSVVLPLVLFGITLTQQPASYRSYQLNLRSNLARYTFFTILIAGFALTTIKGNELSNNNFSIIVEKTKNHINKDLNAVLYEIQDSLAGKRQRYSYSGLIKILGEDRRFKDLLNDSVTDNYTRSILKQLISKPANAFRIDNPLYMLYDNDQYSALYNEHLYLELPPVENRKVWNGSVTENLSLPTPMVSLSYNNNNSTVALPYFKKDPSARLQLAIMPAAWFTGARQPVGILDIKQAGQEQAGLLLYKKNSNNLVQYQTRFANSFNNEDIATLNMPASKLVMAYSNSGNYFAVNKWINGSYKILYPQKEHNFWMYHFANAIRNAYKADSVLQDNIAISLDYNLYNRVQEMIDQAYEGTTRSNRRFRFSVAAADADGNIRLMNDFVRNRIRLDPNDVVSIARLQQKHFFFSNIRNERDQWGNSNLLAMRLGPGSSVKPLIAAAIASQANAGWGQLHLMAPAQTEYVNYGGFKLLKPWENDDHYRAELSLDKYIEVSSNFYQSAMIFLGSYPRSAFVRDNVMSLKHVLSSTAGPDNTYPVFTFNGNVYYLPNYNHRKGAWPLTNEREQKKKSFFGNEHSLLADGLETNTRLRTQTYDGDGNIPASYTRVNIVDSPLYTALSKNKGSYFLWSFPEQSSFLQAQRAFTEPYQNFNLGLKTTTLGGYPYQVSPLKMLEMYTALFTQNRNLELKVLPGKQHGMPWQTDASWREAGSFNQFLSAYIFKGMNDVIYGGSGTGHALGGLRGAHPGFYFYAKTGTINEEGSGAGNSRRLVVAITNQDMQQAASIGQAGTKVYTLYFTVDNNKDFDWTLLNNIINEVMASRSFQHYFR
ncbi:hypothetical protein [Taibaiella koreensis]|uniref:hypothetical protein n=1 Tax=Taibaiella koreensis TaxID=1268548 RepID=UPI000E5A0B5A|nr:hypothetical protein [Taibaiella koreensis]